MHKSFPLLLLALSSCLVSAAQAQSLRGSRASVDLMYRQAQNHGLHFYETPSGVRKAANKGVFVHLGGNANYKVASVSHPYLLPSTQTFVLRLASQYRSVCGEKIVVTSAIRPKSQRLANSVDKSVHPTGMAVDLRKPNKPRCLKWLRETLSELDAMGVIEATEERNPPHFHVAVFPDPYRRYVARQGGSVKLAANSSSKAGGGKGSSKAKAPVRTAANSESASSKKYKVRQGESLWVISRKHNVPVDEIKNANDLRSSRIVAGQLLVIPEAQ